MLLNWDIGERSSLLRLLCRALGPWLNMEDMGGSEMETGRCRSMDPAGLSRRVGLVMEGAGLEPREGARLMRELQNSSALFSDPEEEEFRRKDRRSRRDCAGSGLAPTSPGSFSLTMVGSAEDPVSGSEPERNRVLRVVPFSNALSDEEER